MLCGTTAGVTRELTTIKIPFHLFISSIVFWPLSELPLSADTWLSRKLDGKKGNKRIGIRISRDTTCSGPCRLVRVNGSMRCRSSGGHKEGRKEKRREKKGRLENKNFHLIARWRKEKKRLDPVDVGNGRYLQKSFGRHRQVSAGAKWQAAWEMERKSKSRRLIRSNRIRADGSRGDFGASRPSHSLNKLLGVQVNWCSLSHQTSQKIQMKEEKKERTRSQSKKIDKSGF